MKKSDRLFLYLLSTIWIIVLFPFALLSDLRLKWYARKRVKREFSQAWENSLEEWMKCASVPFGTSTNETKRGVALTKALLKYHRDTLPFFLSQVTNESTHLAAHALKCLRNSKEFNRNDLPHELFNRTDPVVIIWFNLEETVPFNELVDRLFPQS